MTYWVGPVMTVYDDGSPCAYAAEYGDFHEDPEAALARASEMSLARTPPMLVAVLRRDGVGFEVIHATDGEPILGPVSVWGMPR